MADWSYINDDIDSNIYTNGNRAISAATLNPLMKSMLQAVGNNLPTPGTGLRQGTGTDLVRELSIDGEYTSYYATSAGEDEYTRVCMLRNGTLLYNNIMIAVGYGRYTGRKSDLLFINVGGAEPAIQTLTSSGTFFLENAGSGTFFLCVKKETSSNTILKCAFSVLMASQNDGFDIKSGVLSSFDFLTTEEATTGAIIASTCLTDALGFTPENSANKKTTLADNSDTYYPTQKAVKTAVDAKADDSSVVHNTGAETVSGVKTFSNGLINGSLFFGSPITPISLSGNVTWNIDDLKTMMKVVLSGSTNTITLPNGGENSFRFQIIVAQDGTGSRALTISGASGVNVYNPSEFDFSSGSANQICVCTIIWDGTEYIYECTNYLGVE